MTEGIVCEACRVYRACFNLTTMPGSPFGVLPGQSRDLCMTCLLAVVAKGMGEVERMSPEEATRLAIHRMDELQAGP